MRNLELWPTLALAMLFSLFISSCAGEPELIPREILFGNPVKVSPKISPNGKMMAYLAPVNNVLNVWVRTVGKEDDRAVTGDAKRGIRRYFWAQDNTHIMYLQDVGGNENWRLYGVDLASGGVRDYTPFENVQVQIVKVDKKFPGEILVAMNKNDPRIHDVYRLNLSSGELDLIAENPGNVVGWIVDADFRVRGAQLSLPDGGFELIVRESERAPWRKLVTWSIDDSFSSGPIGFSRDGRDIYLVDSRDANTGRLVRLNIPTGEITVLAEDPNYDVSGVMINPDTYEVEAVSFARARTEWVVLDKSVKGDFAAIRKLDGGDFSVVSRDNSDDTWVIGYTHDNGPVSYYTLDRRTGKGRFLFYHQPALNRYRLASMNPVSFTSRDGLTIHGYITCPVGVKRKKLPLVLNVHGGPWTRDMWGYDAEAQWLANRGYVCLQVNYRGSTGYGKNFLNAGNKEWGRKMHYDLVDGVKWAVERGIADPEKVAIYGGSYGGYAALVGATFTPDLFRCAVDLVGPTNLITLIKSIPPYWTPLLSTFYKRVGNPDTEQEFLKSRSPLFRVDQIKIPVLIAQGANDPRVKQAESDQFVAAMKKKGIEYEYLLFPDEGHGFARPENRLKFYAAAEKFLAKYLGGRFEPERKAALKK